MIRRFSLALLASMLLAVPAHASRVAPEAAGSRAAARVETGQRAPVAARGNPGTRAELRRYAQREAASPNARHYRGGDMVIYIGASALVVILVIVLLIVLL